MQSVAISMSPAGLSSISSSLPFRTVSREQRQDGVHIDALQLDGRLQVAGYHGRIQSKA